MAASERELMKRMYRHAGRAVLEREEGEAEGRGLVAPLRNEAWEPGGGRRHPLGNLPQPFYRFTGYLPELLDGKGGVLIQNGLRYTVLDAREVSLGERSLCIEALLERRDAGDDGA